MNADMDKFRNKYNSFNLKKQLYVKALRDIFAFN